MNKAEFVHHVAEAAGLTKVDAAKAIDAVIGVIEAALKKGDSVAIVGFGTFSVRKRAARSGRNPQHRSHHQDQGLEDSCLQGWQGTEGRDKLELFSPGCLAQR